MLHYPHNPILPADTFIPDVEAHVWQDGRIYLYGSYDIGGNPGYCCGKHHVYSSDDMIHWTDHGVAFTTADIAWLRPEEKTVPLYAPDCAYRNGKYYLYYCIPDGRCGVAISDVPTGPFTDVCQLQYVHGIDPAVLIDDDGQAYLYWGQMQEVKAAKLRENMIEIDPDSITQPLTVPEHDFHEGSSVRKIGGKYYYLYTDTHRHKDAAHPIGMATCLGYAVSDHPMTGYRYGGVLLDNYGCDPKTWNDHGSMAVFQGQWYLFYHRSTHASESSRHVCVEPITIDENGRIAEVPMTSSGVGEALLAEQIPAYLACVLTGNVRKQCGGRYGLVLAQTTPGDTAVFRYVSFAGENTVTLTGSGTGEVVLATEEGVLGKVHLNEPTAISPRKGRAVLTLTFTEADMSLDAIQFAIR